MPSEILGFCGVLQFLVGKVFESVDAVRRDVRLGSGADNEFGGEAGETRAVRDAALVASG